MGAQTVVLTATDPSGNIDTVVCSFNVVDSESPVAVCPSSIADVVLDGSGNGRTFSQSTGSFKPDLILASQNGLDVVRFDGIGDYLTPGRMNDAGWFATACDHIDGLCHNIRFY